MRKIFLFFLFCSLLVTLIIVFRIPLLEWSIPKYLSLKNFRNISLTLQSCSLDRLETKSFSADFIHNQQQYTVSTSQISLQYTFAGLSAQKVDRLTIQRATITLPSTSPAHQKKPVLDPPTIKKSIKLLQEVTIPVKEIVIKQLFFNGMNADRLKNAPIALELNTTDKELQSDLLFHLPDQEDITVTFHRRQNQPLSVLVRHTKQKHTVQSLQLTADEAEIEAQATVSIEDLSRHFLVKQLQGQTGKVKASFVLQLKNRLSLHLQIHASGLQHPRYSVRELNVDMQATLDADKRVTISDTSMLQAEGLSNGNIQAQHLDFPMASTLTPTVGGIKVTFSSSQPWQVKQLEATRISIQEIRIPPLKELLITKGITSLFPQLAPLIIHGVDVAGWHIPKLIFTPGAKVPITLQSASKTIKLISPPWRTDTFTLKKDTQQFVCESIHVDLKDTAITDTVETDLSLKTSALLLASGKMALPIKETSGKVTIKNHRLNATLQMMPSKNGGKIQITVKHGLNSGKGMARVTTEEPILFSQSQGIATLVKGILLPLTLISGKFSTYVAASWQKESPFKADALVQFTDGVGVLKDIPFSGLQIDQTLDLLPELRSRKPGKLKIAQMNGAIPVSNLQATFTLSPSNKGKYPRVAVQQLGADIMQGHITTDPFNYMPGTEQQAVTIRAESVDLAEIVSLLKVKGLQVDGKLNGYLPLTIDRKKVSLDNGEFYGSKQGGTIRFRPQGLPTQHSQLTTYALKALEEFDFTVLKAPVKYLPDGTLLVDIQLQGISPSLSTTRPVHLNIHTEQNLLSLLKSLRYNNALTKDLDKQLQKRY